MSSLKSLPMAKPSSGSSGTTADTQSCISTLAFAISSNVGYFLIARSYEPHLHLRFIPLPSLSNCRENFSKSKIQYGKHGIEELFNPASVHVVNCRHMVYGGFSLSFNTNPL